MRAKIQELVERVSTSIAGFGTLDGLMVMESNRDVHDPYFILSLDAYFDGPVASGMARQLAFEWAGAFEGSPSKDRFLVGDIPLRVEYRDINQYLCLLQGDFEPFVSNTYALRRLSTGTIIKDPRSRLGQLRTSLATIPKTFWTAAFASASLTLEHDLEDLKTSALMEDELNFAIARGRLLQGLVAACSAANRAFMPGPRMYTTVLDNLSHLPLDFSSKLRTLLSWTNEPLDRQAELAELLVGECMSVGLVHE